MRLAGPAVSEGTPFAPDTALPCAIRPSPNHGDRKGRAVDSLVLHYTGMASAEAALQRLCDPAAEVSSHYLVDEDGQLFQLVPEGRRAWHAGRSFWQGERDINSVSIGIEIANGGHDADLPAFPDPQIATVLALCRDTMLRHGIAPVRVLGHSDIAPGRKVDPGERFPWERLAAMGVGVWPKVSGEEPSIVLAQGARGRSVQRLQDTLGRWGVDTRGDGLYDDATRIAVRTFQLHYRPARVDGVADPDTVARLHALTAEAVTIA